MIDRLVAVAQVAGLMAVSLSRLRRPGRTWLAAMLAVAIALRLLVPVGWMPAPGGGLMVCDGVARGVHAAHGGGHDQPAGHQQDHPCAFAALSLAAAPPAAAPAVLAPPAVASGDHLARVPASVGRGLAAPPPPATGPPAFA